MRNRRQTRCTAREAAAEAMEGLEAKVGVRQARVKEEGKAAAAMGGVMVVAKGEVTEEVKAVEALEVAALAVVGLVVAVLVVEERVAAAPGAEGLVAEE